jgi:hypothetical protein
MGSIGRTALFVSLSLIGWLTLSQSAPQNPRAAYKNEIERGRYLVEEVAKCPECHTPRNARGELDRNAWLQGAPIWIMPVRPIPNWADRAVVVSSRISICAEPTLNDFTCGTKARNSGIRQTPRAIANKVTVCQSNTNLVG